MAFKNSHPSDADEHIKNYFLSCGVIAIPFKGTVEKNFVWFEFESS